MTHWHARSAGLALGMIFVAVAGCGGGGLVSGALGAGGNVADASLSADVAVGPAGTGGTIGADLATAPADAAVPMGGGGVGGFGGATGRGGSVADASLGADVAVGPVGTGGTTGADLATAPADAAVDVPMGVGGAGGLGGVTGRGGMSDGPGSGGISGSGGVLDAGSVPGSDAGPSEDSGATANPYVWVAIQDTEQIACTTNAPGADIDAVALVGSSGVLGVGRIGTAVFTPNPLGDACANADCNGGNCKYAAISKTIPESTLVAYTEGAQDGMVNAVGNDTGYLSLNGGALQIQIGDLTGSGPAKALKSGEMIEVFELDKTYIAAGSAPVTCSCLPEHYTVTLQTASGLALTLKPGILAADNVTCAALAATSTEGCGSTVFLVP